MILGAAERGARLDHAGVAAVLDWGVHQGRAFVVTASHGRSLTQVVDAAGPLTEREVLRMTVLIADAVAYLHGEGMVYQIVNPGSVNVGYDGRELQLAWPLFLVRTGTPATDTSGEAVRAGVPPYGGPEALDLDGTIEPSMDVYGIGETAYFLLSGRPAHTRGKLGLAEHYAQKRQRAVPLREFAHRVTAPTASLVEGMLDPDPMRRPAASEVRDRATLLMRRLTR